MSSAAKHVLALLLLVVGGWFGIGDAQAVTGCNSATNTCDTRQHAWELAGTYGAGDWCPIFGVPGPPLATYEEIDVSADGQTGRVRVSNKCNGAEVASSTVTWTGGCGVGGTWDAATHTCKPLPTCTAGEDKGKSASPVDGSLFCALYQGDQHACWVTTMVGPDGYKHSYVIGGGDANCDGPDPQCPAGYQHDPQAVGTTHEAECYPIPDCPAGVPVDPKSGLCTAPEICPAGQKRDTASGVCVPDPSTECGEGKLKGPDGTCVDSNSCNAHEAKGADGTCKPDANDDGIPDAGDGSHKAKDSMSCNTPPVCDGDEIMCLHAKQLWRVDCNTQRNARTDIDVYCQRPPVCEQIALGDMGRTMGCTNQEEAALTLQWKTMCAVQALLEKESGSAGVSKGYDDANNNGIPDWTERTKDGTEELGADEDAGGAGRAGLVKDGEAIGGDGLDVSGLGFARTCPQMPVVNVRGTMIDFNRPELCNWMQLGGQFVLLLAALASLRLIAGGL